MEDDTKIVAFLEKEENWKQVPAILDEIDNEDAMVRAMLKGRGRPRKELGFKDGELVVVR